MVQEDLLAQFIDGKLSEEEAASVADILSSEDESLQEWRQSIVAASLADSPAPVKVDRRKVRSIIARQRRNRNGFSFWAGVSLALVACLAVAVIVFRQPQAAVQTETLVADNTQPADADTKLDASQALQEQVVSKPNKPASPATRTVNAETAQPEDVSTASASPAAAIRRNVEMIKPSKDNYSVRVVNPSRSFVFRWEMVGAVEARIAVLDKNGILLASDKGPRITELSIPAKTLLEGSPVSWKLSVDFTDGSVQEKTGTISFTKGY